MYHFMVQLTFDKLPLVQVPLQHRGALSELLGLVGQEHHQSHEQLVDAYDYGS